MRCVHCGGTNFDEDRARADLICLDCGMVVSENVITSEVEFMETSTGQAAAVGRFVSDESQVLGNRESKLVTENKARRRIDTICGHLRLGGDVSTSAFRYYQSALFRGITRGRGALQVASGCIYLAARQLRVNLMLLDLSDAVGVNVYVLGRCYAELKRRLHLSIPEMDPCLYIERFASQLELGDKMPIVATTAMRLLQRMKRDWISTGRRPSGLTAAALLVAARIHEFNRTEEDVARIARISQQTTRKRLEEFSRTPSSALSIEAFFTVDYEDEHDPPAFSVNKKSEANEVEMDEKSFERIRSEIQALQERIDSELQALAEKKASRSFAKKLGEMDVGKSKGVRHLLDSPDESPKPSPLASCSPSSEKANFDLAEPSSTAPGTSSSLTVTNCIRDNVLREVLDGLVEPSLLDGCVEELEIITKQSGEAMFQALQATEAARCVAEANFHAGLSSNAGTSGSELPSVQHEDSHTKITPDGDTKSMKLPIFIPMAHPAKVEYPTCEDGSLPLDEIDDDELDHEYILQPKEVVLKAAIWYKANAQYLQTARKRRLEKLQRLEQDSKHPIKKSRKRPTMRSTKRSNANFDSSGNAGENLLKDGAEEVEERLLSRKINYAALEAVVGSTSVSHQPPPITPVSTDLLTPGPLTPGPLLASTLMDDILPQTSQTQDALYCKDNGVSKMVAETNEVDEDHPEEDEEELFQETAEVDEEDDEDDDLGWQQGAELW